MLGFFGFVCYCAWRTFKGDKPEPLAAAGKTAAEPIKPLISLAPAKPVEKAEPVKQEDSLEMKVLSLASRDKGFEPQAFMESARQAFDIILKSFEEGDVEAIRPLVSAKVAKSLEKQMAALAAKKHKLSTEIVRYKKVYMEDIAISDKSARIVVHIITEQTALLTDAKGKIIEGDENSIREVKDAWAFERNFSSRGGWVLVEMLKADK
jgi:predicted lipid-binding transport protein (Tim44 family)